MITPLIMLLLMTMPCLLVSVWSKIAKRTLDKRTAAAVGLAILFTFTGIGHFVKTAPMAEMLPPWVPARISLVYLTGLLEFALAAGFLISHTRRAAGSAAILLLLVFFPINIYAAIQHIPMGGHAWGPVYLWIRAPLQGIILLWTWWFTIRKPSPTLQPAAKSPIFL